MRRKVIQDFANVFCQRFIQLPNGYDLATFVRLGSGSFAIDILTGVCTRNLIAISRLKTCDQYKDWLVIQLARHQIPLVEIKKAALQIDVLVSQINVRKSFGHVFASALFSFDCRSEIHTDEKTYGSQLQYEKKWGFDIYYEKLYGSPLELLQQ